jgi:D-alanyl-lipoteichoic acid acyltransferase DltB (MBOAT superfamily)
MSVDLATPPFWIAVVLAYLLLTPLVGEKPRQTLFFLINLSFALFLVGPDYALGTLVLLALTWVLVGVIASPGQSRRTSACQILGLGLTVAFLLAKKREWAVMLSLGPTSATLAGLGFSYVVLRMVYLMRAVWEGRAMPPSLLDFVNYLLPFHMLAAGPIAKYEEFRAADLGSTTGEDLLVGLERISTGLFKKFVLAASLKLIFLSGYEQPNWGYRFLEMQVSYLWLYLDFSGYSDIAVGVGRLLGFRVPENFDRPLLARNLIEFWQRWHITLSNFVKTEIFMPLQFFLMRGKMLENRPLLAASISFCAAFVLCGLWHGISLRFALWGLVHGVGVTACRTYQSALLSRLGRAGYKRLLTNRWLQVVSVALTFEYVAISWFIATGPLELVFPGLTP